MFWYRLLEIDLDATIGDIRQAYHSLALRHHPNKADERDREESTIKFHKLHAAYKHCLTHVPATDQDVVIIPTDWRGRLPSNIGRMGTAWWLHLEELDLDDVPESVARWAEILKRADHMHARRMQTSQGKRDLLKFDAKDYEHDYGYYDDEASFDNDGTKIPMELCNPDDWRTKHKVNAKVTTEQQLELFRRQMRALQQRAPNPKWSGADEERRAKRLEAIEQHMAGQIAQEEDITRKEKVNKRALEPVAMQNKAIIGVQAEPTVPFLLDIEERNLNVPDCWEDETDN